MTVLDTDGGFGEGCACTDFNEISQRV